MKILHENKWEYMGETSIMTQKMHVFRNIFYENQNAEFILLAQAQLIKRDGSRIYYDLIKS